MTILITYASKHGSTREIAERIAKTLLELGKQVETRSMDTVWDPEKYEALIIGSAIYYGSWLKVATEWVHRHQTILTTRPVWLFSSGPLGTEVKDDEPQPKEIAEFQKALKPRDQRIFFGALDHSRLSFAERIMLKAVRAPEGDFRDWAAIDAWVASIARDLTVSSKESLV
ncbi:flavodoxin [Dictyobacter alpinus]|uniref:Flavodoxin n=1 Tax=Dictyobacter alpinus TaxID=2014873 RepID=A0A402B141_9CHLR|nr:flavodoxin domain-containing protein [Dictyobacter alpinus]GCE25071.1 flavodoxin [Dictyobacter alpinus]